MSTRARLSPIATSPTDAPVDLSRQAAERVLDIEAAAVLALKGALDASFPAVIELLAAVAGRVVVTGMGKSGHIARKIAATLASTGTPAQFVHPGEASHGDLGMIAPSDAVLALSYSGETEELRDIVAYSRRFAIPLIAITGRAGSALARAADATLLLPAAVEACPLGLAPTTSTTMMLALGDALAVALLERKGFSADAFHGFHPRGALGRKFLRVADLMHRGDDLPLVAPDLKMSAAILVMTGKRLGCVGATEDGSAGARLVGIVTDGDLRRRMAPDLLDRTVAAVMTEGPQTIRPDALAAEALGVLNQRQITGLFVVEDGRPVGFLHIHDILRAGVA